MRAGQAVGAPPLLPDPLQSSMPSSCNRLRFSSCIISIKARCVRRSSFSSLGATCGAVSRAAGVQPLAMCPCAPRQRAQGTTQGTHPSGGAKAAVQLLACCLRAPVALDARGAAQLTSRFRSQLAFLGATFASSSCDKQGARGRQRARQSAVLARR